MKKIYSILFSVLSVSFSNAQQLDVLIDEGIANNPEIQSFELKYQLAKEKVNEVNILPNAEIGFGFFASEPETRTGAQRFKVSVNQMLPSFGVITARENYNSSLADVVYEDVAIAKRKLAVAISQSYYELYGLGAKQLILEENIVLLDTYEELALSSIETGTASAVDVLRLQIRRNELAQLKAVLHQDYLAEQTKLNKLLNREKSIVVVISNELIMPSENKLFDSENLVLHPELLKYDKLYESIEKSELVNKKEGNPILGFGLDYIAVSERPNMTFSDNGKDILMPMAKLSIPIFNSKYKSKTVQNQLLQQEINTQKQAKQNRLETLLDNAVKKSNSARISYNTKVKNLKQAKDAETILLKSYESATIDFNDVLDIQELQLKFQINQIESIKTYYLQTIIINYLTN